MKKILNISVIAALAILPMAANAEPIYDVTSTDPGTTNASGPEAANPPKYSLAAAGANDDTHMATAGYVKGAYNAAIKAVNKVAATAGTAVQGVKVNGSELSKDANGKVDVLVAEGATNGTVAVNGTDVAVHGLGSAAYVNTGDLADTANTYDPTTSGLTATTIQDAIDEVEGRVDTAEGKIGTTPLTTTAQTLTGAIEEVKSNALTSSALTDYAKKTGVTQTITNSSISGTVPVLTTWNDDTSTDTVDITASITGATYAEPVAQGGGGDGN